MYRTQLYLFLFIGMLSGADRTGLSLCFLWHLLHIACHSYMHVCLHGFSYIPAWDFCVLCLACMILDYAHLGIAALRLLCFLSLRMHTHKIKSKVQLYRAKWATHRSLGLHVNKINPKNNIPAVSLRKRP